MASDGTQPVNQTNGLGIAGLVVSILGILTCGLISPLGLLLSLIAMLKRPRGLAIAGTVVGLVGTGILFLVGGSIVAGFMFAGKAIETAAKIEQAKQIIAAYHTENGSYPDGIEGNKLIDGINDDWGNALRYDGDEQSYTIRSASFDGKMDTPDDIQMGPSDFNFDVNVDDPDLGIQLGDGDGAEVQDGGDGGDTGDN
jgi:hypothetical protein